MFQEPYESLVICKTDERSQHFIEPGRSRLFLLDSTFNFSGAGTF